MNEGSGLIRVLKQRKRSIIWLSKQLGITRQTIHNWAEQRSNPRDSSTWDKIAELLDVPVSELHDPGHKELPEISGPLFPVSYQLIPMPLYSPVPCGNWVEPEETEDFIELDAKFSGPRRFAAKILGDSCYPVLHQGDVAIFQQDYNPSTGLIVLARRLSDHAATVKVLAYDSVNRRYKLKAINPESEDADDINGWQVYAYLVGMVRVVNGTEISMYNPHGIRPS